MDSNDPFALTSTELDELHRGYDEERLQRERREAEQRQQRDELVAIAREHGAFLERARVRRLVAATIRAAMEDGASRADYERLFKLQKDVLEGVEPGDVQ